MASHRVLPSASLMQVPGTSRNWRGLGGRPSQPRLLYNPIGAVRPPPETHRPPPRFAPTRKSMACSSFCLALLIFSCCMERNGHINRNADTSLGSANGLQHWVCNACLWEGAFQYTAFSRIHPPAFWCHVNVGRPTGWAMLEPVGGGHPTHVNAVIECLRFKLTRPGKCWVHICEAALYPFFPSHTSFELQAQAINTLVYTTMLPGKRWRSTHTACYTVQFSPLP
mmetsp:Transcript_37042/g.109202  ORF Transcript_37042/g.109202 Transcript_37042/m.109202 type:complete len:225 (-) Transcript_37042:86-760(-)